MPSMSGRHDSVSGFESIPTLTFDQITVDRTISESENQEVGFGEDRDLNPPRRYHRHTQEQIQRMEALFNECQHPDDKQRKDLGRELGLTPMQIKFWFQNKRTHVKAQQEREQSSVLRIENEKLRADNTLFKDALKNASCVNCCRLTAIGEMPLDEQQLKLENAHLRDQIEQYAEIAANYTWKLTVNYPSVSPFSIPRRTPQLIGSGSGGNPGENPGGIGRDVNGGGEGDKLTVIDLAVAAMKELIGMAQTGEPLWFATMDSHTDLLLNEAEYNRRFPQLIGPKPENFRRDASKESGIILMDHIKLVEMFMDVNQWSAMFSDIVSSATTSEVLASRIAGSYDGVFQVMTAEFQVPSPLTPNRESNFVRYCKKYNEGIWVVVDVSLDNLQPNPLMGCRRKPTGCIIQQVPNGCSKVIWVEHVEVDNRNVHDLLKLFVSFGNAFGAKRWMATLDRQSERLASTLQTDIPALDFGVVDLEGRKKMLKLAERMVTSFFNGVNACSKTSNKTHTGMYEVRIVTRESVDDPRRPRGLVLIAATSFWLPHLPNKIFEFLCDNNSRPQWDILCKGGTVQEMGHITNGRNAENCVTVLDVNNVECCMSMIQETMSDSMGSYLIYAPTDLTTMNRVHEGLIDPDYVNILPSGFAILPDGTTADGGGLGGSLVTVAYQTLANANPRTELSLEDAANNANSLIDYTADRIKRGLSPEVARSNGTRV